MKQKLSIIALALVAILGVQSAKAWGGFGHTAIAYVAEQHLTPEAKAKCRYYLKHTLAYYASWMDYWRSVPQFKSVNNPHSNKVLPDGRNLDWENGNPRGYVMGHLDNALSELGNGRYKNLPDSVVRQRLINMVHYVPDMHCPVHVGFPKKQFSHYRYNIYRKGKKISYHGFWDGSPAYKRSGWSVAKYAQEVDKVTPKQAKKWVKGSLDDWGRDIIRQAHRCYQITTAECDVAQFNEKDDALVLELSDEMAMKGAYRLAHVLNTIFAE